MRREGPHLKECVCRGWGELRRCAEVWLRCEEVWRRFEEMWRRRGARAVYFIKHVLESNIRFILRTWRAICPRDVGSV